MRIAQKKRELRLLPLTVAVLACLGSATAYAQSEVDDQDTEAQEEQTQDEVVELDRLTVTGSLIRRVEYDSVSPVQVITADTNVTLGQVEAAEFLQTSSIAAGSTQINNQFSGFVIEGGSGVQTVSLRGLGAQRSLVLLNGQRPGPAGTRGQVGSFDLNVIPTSIIQRVELLKDGGSSIYGSDAVAGVANIITRRNIDRPEITVNVRAPFEGGGETFTVSGATGWNFDRGGITLAAEWFKREALKVGDRDFFECSEDLFWDAEGNRIDREDRSILAGTDLAGCNNLYANTVIDALFGDRYIPSPDGTTVGLIPGYRPRNNQRYDSPGGQAYYEDVLNFDFFKDQYISNDLERFSVYSGMDFVFDNFNWNAEILLNRRENSSNRFRQFFPLVGGATSLIPSFSYANDPTYIAPVPSGLAQPVIPFRSNGRESVDYYYVGTGVDGLFSWADTWAWEVDGSYSRSDGDYSSLGIVASRSGDVRFDDDAPVVDYFNPAVLNGDRMDELESAIGEWHTGNTVYDQMVFRAIATGELFDLPAGAVAAAFGAEYREYSIDDQPSDLSANGDLWGQSSAQQTKGSDAVREILAEIEVPLISGVPGFEELKANVSGRMFKYDSIEDSDHIWKVGFSWQMTPSFRMRATRGTSFRAPGLYELYLGNQTAFLSQLAIDPCIDWGPKTNEFLRANCAAEGIPSDYAGGSSSATVVTGGGAGLLKPETSLAQTVGIVFTPEFADFSIALDYWSFDIRDTISQLGGGAILGGCYGAPVYPNGYCNLFDRNPGDHPTAPFAITEVRDSYLNVNKLKTRGYDLLFRYEKEIASGNLDVEGSFTYVMEDFEQLFDSQQASGFDTNDFNGSIGRPKVVGNLRTAFQRNDWTLSWFVDYVHETRALDLSPITSYNGITDARRDIVADRAVYHGASVLYDQPDWSVLVGVRNLLDEAPPFVSSGVASRYGNVPAFATQYDWLGRTGFVQFRYKF
ncbi:TonB-dependent receptor domain-containing protein [Lysobacter sp. A3-1-A15]|uniref:TonB-dependent receptor domain-containing protein n=1 Tax=Novilysobacter viscosus TaxID=3098602 RepID=UPI002ED9CC69